MDETLSDTTGANVIARDKFRDKVTDLCGSEFKAAEFAAAYLEGMYKRLTEEMKEVLLPITDEEEFRTDLLAYLFKSFGFEPEFNRDQLNELRVYFDDARIEHFDFFPGVKGLLSEFRQIYTLVVITNGPIYSQHPKISKLDLHNHVDHIIVGGEEPEEKPYPSIFEKACRLANCRPNNAVHFGDGLEPDIKGAKNAGIKAVWVSKSNENSSLPDYTISNFIESRQALEFLQSQNPKI